MENPLIPSTSLHCLPYNHDLHPESCMERELSSRNTYGRSPAAIARKAFWISSELWTFSVSLEIMKAMYSWSETAPSRLGSTTSKIASNSGSLCPSSIMGRSYPSARRQDLNSAWFRRPHFSLSKCCNKVI
ncbi:hypothetical protein E2C01_048589 [Portunus trituberculatus]|uniref:Uncharacterized protein n=1 Tax=Portunus trituberculatus TaxID=210409 RepID=A0A5B7GBG3_PORTR|nr:hypothetical protein [Portunus trituberculatus]